MRFTKMQGIGNDFVVIDGAELTDGTDLSSAAIGLCDRHIGIGADGLLVVLRAPQDQPDAQFRMRMFNPDGSEDMCGNGLRCVSLWAFRAGWLTETRDFTVAVKDGVRAVRLLEADADGRNGIFGVDMGVPEFSPPLLPFCAPADVRIVDFPLAVGSETYRVTVLNTGSTHSVIFGALPSEETFQRVSPQIETHSLFPARTSVLWAVQEGENRLGVRIWERGVGETLGCGTGATAVAVAAQLHGFVRSGEPVEVVSRGGTLTIQWPGEGFPVDMVGPATVVFEGRRTDSGEGA